MSQEFLSPDQQEIVDLLLGELNELASLDSKCLETDDLPAQSELLNEYQIHLEHLGNALEIAGLAGLSFCTKRLIETFTDLKNSGTSLPQNLAKSLGNWPLHFVAYLQNLGNSETEEKFVHELITFFCQPELPSPFTEEEVTQSKELFNISDLSITENEPALPTQVTAAMSSLDIAADVRPELFQGMLIELPEQVKQFESSVSDFLASSEFGDLQQAQRIAHTIKGAANVVSIHGMANLTHFAEDVLETAAKQKNEVPDGFEEMLVRTSDCLAATAEFLNRQGPAPDDLGEVMQLLLDWLNKLKGNTSHTITTHDDLAEHVTETSAATETPKTPDIMPRERPETGSEAKETERFINLQEKTAQELLRLSGEMHICNNQVAAQISTMENSLTQTDRFHKEIKTMATELEALIQTQSALRAATMKYNENEIDPLEMERFSELHTFSHRLLELTTDSYETISSIDQQIRELSNLTHSQKQLNNDNQHILLEMNLLPASTLSARFSRCARQTCRLTGKSASLDISGEELLLDSRVLSRIADPIMHLIRNAIDHGLENNAGERKRLGKADEGKIHLSFINRGDNIEIVCEDDGNGLDYTEIKSAAVERGLLNDSDNANHALLNQLILMPGFSTRDKATQTSGRGIGLDSVLSEIRALKGNLNISSTPGKGCRITIVVPTSILTSHALLVECRDRHLLRTYGIASRGIQQVIYVDEEEIIHQERNLYYEYNQERIPVQTIGELLNVYSLEEEKISALMIAERNDGSPIAIGVEKISASQDLVIKPLNRFSYQVPGVIGATILGDGSVSPVIDISELPGMTLSEDERNLLQEKRARMILAEKARFIAPPAALVVDDSLSARRSLAQFVSDLGMEVYTAKDGFDAINVMEEKKPSLMLVDLEMPRMNGLELTAHIRSRAEYQNIPVVMITSRSTSRHKEMAKDAGVTHYLTKPWSDDELLNCIQKEIA